MQFVDECSIHVRAGAGGKGCIAFRRESHVPKGGPAGGDGGRGGDVILQADSHLSTLLDLRYQREYRAARGEHGQGHDRDGRSGKPFIVRVPCGTVVSDRASGELLADLIEPAQVFIAARGGRGGRGNRRFVSPTHRAPRHAEPGQPGEERDLHLELRLLADIGLVGLPNSGKSTFIAHVSAARPKVADYPFTTLIPNLGVVKLSDERSFVVADIPGLIAGAHQGAGLGLRFLRHIERTRLLLFILDDRHDLTSLPGSPVSDYESLKHELTAFDPYLIQKPIVVALNKIDLLSQERMTTLKTLCEQTGAPIYPISAATGTGIPQLLEALWHAFRRRTKPLSDSTTPLG